MQTGTVEFTSISQQLSVFGTYDVNVKAIETAFSVNINARDSVIEVKGETTDSVKLAVDTLEALKKLSDNGENINESTVCRIIDLARYGGMDDTLKAMTNVVAITHKGQPIKCKTIGQKNYVKALQENTVAICIGPAGTGKTYLAVAAAVSALRRKEVDRIIMSRPAIEAGEERLGFLPGDLQSKVDPYLRPLYDALDEILGHEQVQRYMENRVIEIAPLAYMRGRTLNSAIVIIDEAQNASLPTLKMALTRLGEGSKIILTGDVTQIDLPRQSNSGLERCASLLKGIDGIAIIHLNNRDVVRHRLVREIVKAFEKDEEKQTGHREKSVRLHYPGKQGG